MAGPAAVSLRYLPTLAELTDVRFDRAAIDMPIGLPDVGYRDCDMEARQLLGSNRSRVFLGARRMLLDVRFESAAQANAELKASDQPGVSVQLWNLRGKLREADRFVRANPNIDLREVHPELVFRRLNGNKPVQSKKLGDGIAQRVRLLAANGFPDVGAMLVDRRQLSAKPDDVLDACAAAIAARDFSKGYALPVGYVPLDDEKLPMQIWY